MLDDTLAADVESTLWADAQMAAQVFALCVRLGAYGDARIRVKAHAGPVRDRWVALLKGMLPDALSMVQVPTNVSAERLLGGLDISLSLSAGKSVEMTGLLAQAHQNILHLPAAGLAEQTTLSLIAAAMDSGDVRVEREGLSALHPANFAFICFDENEADDTPLADALTDRIMLHIDLRSISIRAAKASVSLPPVAVEAPAMSQELRAQICALAQSFGLMSLRPAMQLTVLTKALCQLRGGAQVAEEDVSAAIRLGIVHRAKHLPAPEQERDEAPPPPPEQQTQDDEPPTPEPPADHPPETSQQSTDMPEEMVSETVQAALPHGLLSYLKASQAVRRKGAQSGRRGLKTISAARGRPLASRKGALSAGKRLDLIATLRAAAPWQKARRGSAASRARIHVRKDDLHIRRYHQRSETTTIFLVDASGSTAINRLSEAKGAIELLLGESYSRRDFVALISFRGREAQLLLPPTRALVRAKRSLSSLPGGGGTPLASGMHMALSLAQEELKKGREPSLVILTDGSANVTAEGNGGRKQAAEDAEKAARALGFEQLPTILIDIGLRPQRRAQHYAELMGATYVPMPFASARDLSAAVKAGLKSPA